MNILKSIQNKMAERRQMAKIAKLYKDGDVVGILKEMNDEPLSQHAQWYIKTLKNSMAVKMEFDDNKTTITFVEAK